MYPYVTNEIDAYFCSFSSTCLLAQPLGSFIGFNNNHWYCWCCHQAWSANIFSTVGDMFPKTTIATITGIGEMVGGIGLFIINKGSGTLFDFKTQI